MMNEVQRKNWEEAKLKGLEAFAEAAREFKEKQEAKARAKAEAEAARKKQAGDGPQA